VYTGVALLAAAGCLQGRRATAPWPFLAAVLRQAPVATDADAPPIQWTDAPGWTCDRGVWTCASPAALTEALLDLIGRTTLAPLAQAARDVVLPSAMRRSLPALERAAAGRSLAKLGDPRVEVLDPTAIQFCPVTAGPFWMGEGKDEHLSESVDYDFQIFRYPITVAQFQAFVNDSGYGHRPYWEEAEAHGIWKAGKVQGRWDNTPRNRPEQFDEPFGLPNHPVVGITWYEALAFTRWLTDKLRSTGQISPTQVIKLPSEAEWEKAARSGDKRTFPWGDTPDPERANYDDTGIGFTNAVGCFPGGVTQYETEEMGGNVWEWTRSLHARYPYPSADDERQRREDLSAPDREARVLRGGAFSFNVVYVRCAPRDRNHPHYTFSHIGFRVVLV
jgi:formylglycine-generating enzyme required for sulfatase activity